MKKFLLSLVVFAGIHVQAQISAPSVLASGGGFATGSGFTNSFTIGQGSLPQTFSPGTFILTQGFQQPVDLNTGMAPAAPHGSFEASPNPSQGLVYFEYDLDGNAEVMMEAYNVLGQLIYSEISNRAAGHQLHQLDLSSQNDGVYFIRCTIKTSSATLVRSSRITVSK
jgi:hypothetical protein